MADQDKTTISRSDVEDVASKLESFMQNLPEQEQNVLGWVLTRAAAAPDTDTAGYALGSPALATFNTPIASQLGLASGFGRAASGTTTVTWAYKFGKQGFESLGRPFELR
jgi:hypothetical protein